MWWIVILQLVCRAMVLGGLVIWSLWMSHGIDWPPACYGLWLSLFGQLVASVVFIVTGARLEPVRNLASARREAAMRALISHRGDTSAYRAIWLRVTDVSCHAAIVGGMAVWILTLFRCGGAVLGEGVWETVEPFGEYGLGVFFLGLFAAAFVQWRTGYPMRCFRSN